MTEDPYKPLVDEWLVWLRQTPIHRLENPSPATLDWVRNFLKRCAAAREREAATKVR